MRIYSISLITAFILLFHTMEIKAKSWNVIVDQSGQLIIDGYSEISSPIYLDGVSLMEDSLFTHAGVLPIEATTSGGLHFISTKVGHEHELIHVQSTADGLRLRHIPLWMSVIPPLVAIVLALIFKEVLVSLFFGIWTGAFIAHGFSLGALVRSLVSVIDVYIVQALTDSGHMSVIIFSLMIGGMVAIISKNGGMAGVVQSLSKYARNKRSSQYITWLLGVTIFFDDYANTLIVGNTMRSVTDRFRVSREKLAYLVDSTAAPVAAVAFITTWIGAELGYIGDGLNIIQSDRITQTPYAVFLHSLSYSFYPILTLSFMLMIIKAGRDFGPMWHAEQRAHTTGRLTSVTKDNPDDPDMEDLTPISGVPWHWANAVLPVMTVIIVTILGLCITGMQATAIQLSLVGIGHVTDSWGQIWYHMDALVEGSAGFTRKLGLLIGNSDSYTALLWSSLCGLIMAIGLTVGRRLINLFNTMYWMTVGFKTMLPAVLILSMAWSLAITTEQLHTADFLTGLITGQINPIFMPVLTFVLSALISFSTGSSWSTMAILYPIAIPTTWAVCHSAGMDHDHSYQLLLNVIAVVLSASVMGDHCSPISDTTILSSLASDCNHIDHVRTQLPYALVVGSVSLILCLVSAIVGGGWWFNLIILGLGLVALWMVVRFVGKPVPRLDSITLNKMLKQE